MDRQICFSTGSGQTLYLTGCFRTAQPDRAADPTGFATPTAGLARPRFPERRARPRRLDLLHDCLAGRRRAPSSRIRPASDLVPGSENRQCHAGAENQTVFEGS
jgi:hypothetical protein